MLGSPRMYLQPERNVSEEHDGSIFKSTCKSTRHYKPQDEHQAINSDIVHLNKVSTFYISKSPGFWKPEILLAKRLWTSEKAELSLSWPVLMYCPVVFLRNWEASQVTEGWTLKHFTSAFSDSWNFDMIHGRFSVYFCVEALESQRLMLSSDTCESRQPLQMGYSHIHISFFLVSSKYTPISSLEWK